MVRALPMGVTNNSFLKGFRRTGRKFYKWLCQPAKRSRDDSEASLSLLIEEQQMASLESILRRNIITTIINGINESVCYISSFHGYHVFFFIFIVTERTPINGNRNMYLYIFKNII